MKTAMTQLVEFLNKLNTDSSEPPNLERRLLQKYCENLLKAEKEQIIGAYMSGKHDSGIDKKYSSEDYYQQTYNLEQ